MNTHLRFVELRDFYNEHGIGPIPRKKEGALYQWAKLQKQQYDKYINEKKTNMNEERIKNLENIGFFDVYENRKQVEKLNQSIYYVTCNVYATGITVTSYR